MSIHDICFMERKISILFLVKKNGLILSYADMQIDLGFCCLHIPQAYRIYRKFLDTSTPLHTYSKI